MPNSPKHIPLVNQAYALELLGSLQDSNSQGSRQLACVHQTAMAIE